MRFIYRKNVPNRTEVPQRSEYYRSVETTVRHGTRDDMDVAAAIWERAHDKRLGYVPPGARKERALAVLADRLTRRDARFLIAERDGRAVGILLGSQGRQNDGAGDPVAGLMHVSYVAVEPRAWGKRVASDLLARLASDARGQGYRTMQLWVVNGNERARAVYERFGFMPSGRRAIDEYGEPIEHYVMALD